MDFQKAQQFAIKTDVNYFKSLQDPQALLFLRHKKSGDTLLHICCRYGSEAVLVYFVGELGANVEVNNIDGKRPLHDAAQYSQEGCLRLLLAHKAEPNIIKRSDWTPLMLACTKSSLNIVDLLLTAGADPSLRNKDGWNSFHLASREGHISILSRLTAANPKVWETRSNNLRSPLHTAALHCRREAVSWMLSHCCFLPDCADSCGVTPFMDALRGGHVDIAKILLENHNVQVEREDRAGRQALHHAAQTGQRSSIDFLVQQLGVSPCAASSRDGETALHSAAKDGQVDALYQLLDLGADISARDRFDRTALDVAAACHQDACVSALQQRENKSNS